MSKAAFLNLAKEVLFDDLKDLKKNQATKEQLLTYFVSFSTIEEIKKLGVEPRWLSSSADEPRDNHINYYNKPIKEAPIKPGEEYNCQCGIGYF